MPASAPRVPVLPVPGDVVGGYSVLADVAHGGMAAVLAVQRQGGIAGFEKLLAMKVLLPHLAAERRFVDMFLDEARIAARIQHANVVQVFDVGEWGQLPYLVMEYLKGQPLSAVLRRARDGDKRVERRILYGILLQVARGLHAAHEAIGGDGARLGVVHRDVSPQNVHVAYDGQVRVVDFGIAVARGRVTTTRTGELKGKLGYVAPEQIDGAAKVDRRADLWAFGVMSYEALTGRRLFRADDEARTLWAVMHKSVEDLHRVDSTIAPEIAEIVMRCLERKMHERPSSAAEIAAVLERAAHASQEEIASSVSARFTAERATEEERLAAATRRTPPPPLVENESSSGKATILNVEDAGLDDPSSVRPLREPAKRGRAWLAVLLALPVAAILGGGGWYALNMRSAVPAVVPVVRTVPSPPDPPADIATPPPIAPIEIHLDVSASARLVLVDGVRHDERPVVAQLDESGRASVEVVDERGQIERRVVTREDDGARLGGAPREARPPRVRRAEPRAPAAEPSEAGDLMRSPYGH